MVLRPDVTINQIYQTANPTLVDISLYPCLIGLNRYQIYKSNAGSYTGGLAGSYEFPSYVSSSVIEDTSALLDVTGYTDVLTPKVYISSTTYGEGLVDNSYITYSLTTTPPSFALSLLTQVVFTLSTGTTGALSGTTFSDSGTGVDFIVDNIRTDDKIYISYNGTYYHELSATTIGSMTTTTIPITKRDKKAVSDSPTTDLTVADAQGVRTLTNASETFLTNGVHKDDLVYVRGWEITKNDLGGTYTAEVASTRTFTDSTMDFTAAGVAAADVVYAEYNDSGELNPLFIVKAAGVGTTTLSVQNLDTTTPFPALATAEASRGYDVRTYTAERDLDGIGSAVTDCSYAAYGAIVGATNPGPNARVLSSAAIANFPAGTVLPNDIIVLQSAGAGGAGDLEAGNPPVFRVVSVPATVTHLVVEDLNSTIPGHTAVDASGTIIIKVYGESVVAGTVRQGASFGAEGAGGAPAGERLFSNNDTTIDYTVTGLDVQVGDYIKDRSGIAIFTVTQVGVGANKYQLFVENVGATPISGATDTYFEHTITSQTDSILTVGSTPTTDTTLYVKNTEAAYPSQTTAFYDLEIYQIVYKTSGTNLDYQIKHTSSGSDLTGSVLVTYSAKRTDNNNSLITITANDYVSQLGYASPANPISLGASKLFEIYSGTAYAITIPDETLASFQTGLLASTVSDSPYSIIPCTNTETVLTSLQSHVTTYSAAAIKKERVGWQCHEEVVQEDRADSTTYPGAVTYTKTTTQTTMVLTIVDLVEKGSIPGDVITFSWNDGVGGTGTDSNKRIISLAAATPAAGQCTIVVENSNTITTPSTGTITAWEVQSKTLTLAERAAKQAAYATNINSYRIRNIWPDSVDFTFTDSVGTFGGSDVEISDYPGWLLCCTEAAKRASIEPSELTAFAGGVYDALNDPFAAYPDYQDTVLDGGNYYLTMLSGATSPTAIRGVTTNTSDVLYIDDNISAQVDYVTKQMRAALKPLVGKYKANASFFEAMQFAVEAVITKVLNEENADRLTLTSISRSTTNPTQFLITLSMIPYFGAMSINVSLYVSAS